MHVAVIGAGVVGLSTALYLREYGAEVTVFDKKDVGAGASWGNAGHLIPAMAVPLAAPRNLRFALSSFYKKNAPVTAPKALDRILIRFLTEFGKNSTHKKHMTSLAQMMVLSTAAIAEFEHLEVNGIQTTRREAPFTSALTHARAARYLLDEFATVTEQGYTADISLLGGDELRFREPLVGDGFNFGIQLNGQSLVDPPQLVANLAKALEKNHVQIVRNCPIKHVERAQGTVRVVKDRGEGEAFDAAVIATGAWLSRLAADHGVKSPVVAGTGYSMSVETPEQTRGMLYFPESKIASTTYRGRLRISSLMQINDADAPSRESSRQRMLRAAKAVLPQLKWDTASEFWSGGRPLTVDGKPLIGRTATEGVYINGGHGMWGVTLGPVSGKYLVEKIFGGSPTVLEKFDPRR